MKYQFIQEFLSSKKFVFLILLGFLTVGGFEYFIGFIGTSIIGLLKNANQFGSVMVEYDLYSTLGSVVNSIIILMSTFIIFKVLKNVDFKFISVAVGLFSSLILLFLDKIFLGYVDYDAFVQNTISISILIMFWTILSESKLTFLKSLSLGFFSYLIVKEFVVVVCDMIYGVFNIISLISAFFFTVISTFIFNIGTTVGKFITKYSDKT